MRHAMILLVLLCGATFEVRAGDFQGQEFALASAAPATFGAPVAQAKQGEWCIINPSFQPASGLCKVEI